MDDPCTLLLRIGPVVVTRADPWPRGVGGEVTSPFPSGAYFTLGAVAAMFGRSSNTLRQFVYQHAAKLDCARYWQQRSSPLPWSYQRLLSERDIETLRSLLFRVVKQIPYHPQPHPKGSSRKASSRSLG